MEISSIQSVMDTVNPATTSVSSSSTTLDQSDFLLLLTTQLQQQDPLEPTDNKDMISQMAQFSSLANTTATNDTLAQIVERLDALIAVQTPALTEEAT